MLFLFLVFDFSTRFDMFCNPFSSHKREFLHLTQCTLCNFINNSKKGKQRQKQNKCTVTLESIKISFLYSGHTAHPARLELSFILGMKESTFFLGCSVEKKRSKVTIPFLPWTSRTNISARHMPRALHTTQYHTQQTSRGLFSPI